MAGSKVALLLFSLAVATALPTDPKINWPENAPSWWPDRLPWPPAFPEEAPSWWPDSLPWPPAFPEEAPSWWPDSLPWPPQKPDGWPDRPEWWPDVLPWPPAIPEDWPDRPEWWPEGLPWPPAIPDDWPDRPEWWPEGLPWPPAIPEEWPDRPEWWPENLPWPPALPEEWPDRPEWWPENLPWPPALPEEWPDRPEWWPESLPWPPQLPEITWPPPGINPDRIPYIPSRDNRMHLFTRNNPSMSQPLIINNEDILSGSNFDGSKRTVVLIHDIRGSSTDNFNAIMVPALLAADDVNIISVDWSAGSRDSTALTVFYSALSGNFVSRFLNWIVEAGGSNFDNFHLVGVGLGATNAGFIGLRCSRKVGYITALDPSRGPAITNLLPGLSLNVAQYTEVIHTDAGQGGYRPALGTTDFYPNGGQQQPGCAGDSACNRNRAIFFFAESIQTGGFTSVKCESWRDAIQGNCHGPDTLNMGGLTPKKGSTGVYYLTTNAMPPFSRG